MVSIVSSIGQYKYKIKYKIIGVESSCDGHSCAIREISSLNPINRVNVVEDVTSGVPADGRPCCDGDRRHGVPITCVHIVCSAASHSFEYNGMYV